jgi:D-glycero-alpha-D-manno-heptose 1-phosphate guanylyltransferase
VPEETSTQYNEKSQVKQMRECLVLTGFTDLNTPESDSKALTVLAPVAGKPFLTYLINHWMMQGVTRFIFSLGNQATEVEEFLKSSYPALSYATVTEDNPSGTGGAVRLALQKAKEENVLIVQGDTLVKADLEKMFTKHTQHTAECTVLLKPERDEFDCRLIGMNDESRITSYTPNDGAGECNKSSGIYLLNKTRFFQRSFPASFSFEKDYLGKYYGDGTFYAEVQNNDVFDISMPTDYAKAQDDLKNQPLDLHVVDSSWTIFIDRDGVINDETIGEYVLQWEQFIFSQGVLRSFKKISDAFGRVLLVTNQKGVGKGLMTEQALTNIHSQMQQEIESAGGRIDKIYFCSDTDNTSFFRKPNPGMAWQAKQDFPDIDFSRSIMVGNKPSDMRFGRAAGMFTVFLATTNPEEPFPHPDVDLRFSLLADFAAALPTSKQQ